MDQPDNFVLDVRIRQRALAKGLITEDAVAEHVSTLSDLEGRYDVLDLEQPLGAREPVASGAPPAGDGVDPRGLDRPTPAVPTLLVSEPLRDEDVEPDTQRRGAAVSAGSFGSGALGAEAPAVAPAAVPPNLEAFSEEREPPAPRGLEAPPPAEPASSRPVSVAPPSASASDGVTEVADNDWDSSEEPSGAG